MTGDLSFGSHLGITAMIVALPFIVIIGTSFAKIAVVLGITRSALGAPGVPPASVITGLAVVMSIFIMAPVATDIADSMEEYARNSTPVEADRWGMNEARSLYDAAAPPLIDFLEMNTPAGEVDFFSDMAGATPGSEPGLRILLPAFATSEIVEAFLIGFLVFIPFLVIDLIVANVLLSMGMHMTSPMAVSLPLKLLLFVVADGWHIIINGLVVSYGL